MTEGSTYDLPTFPVGALRYAACINHADVGRFVNVDTPKATIVELPTDCGGFGEIQFTAECMECDASHKVEKELPDTLEQLFRMYA